MQQPKDQMKFTLRQIAELIDGEVEGDDTLEVERFDKIEEGKAGGISFLANSKYEDHIYQTDSSAVIVSKKFMAKQSLKPSLLRVNDPYLAFTKLLQAYQTITNQAKKGIESGAHVNADVKIPDSVWIAASAYISEGVSLAENVQIFPQVFIGENVRIGKNSIVFPGVKIYKDCIIGENCKIHANAVIGADGFGFAPNTDGSYISIPQTGNVIIKNNVDIGASSTIDRATMGSTIIGTGVKIDNLVQIGHNVIVGDHTVIAAQTGVAGSAKIGKYCVVGGQSGISGHLTIVDSTKLGGRSGVNKSIREQGNYSGYPLLPIQDHLKSLVYIKKMPDLEKRIGELEKEYQKIKSYKNE